MALAHRRAASRECGPVRAAWSMRACARAKPLWAWDERPCLPCHPGPMCPLSHNERGWAVLLRLSSISAQRAWRFSLGRRHAGEAKVAGERMAGFWPAYRIKRLAHGGVDRHR